MSDIALRDYDYEIEAMIEGGDIDEAIAHCKYILTKYPKHLAVYRLLGSALMHAGRRSEAIRIYHRLLSALPDDFEAHYNLGLLYTDQGDIDPALWHTLRAFELQPSNKSVHEKLRDLYTLRDGKSPQIRLTRPALARMYASQPEQTEQAVNEILSILADDPDRIDLEILLAQVYYQSQKYSEAEYTCISILNRIPFCLEANLILAEVYDMNGQAEEAEVHWARVKEIDPYDKRFEKQYTDKYGLMVVDDSSLPPLEEEKDQSAWQGEHIHAIPDGIEISPLVSIDIPEVAIVTSPLESRGQDDVSLNFNLDGTDEESDLVFNTEQDTLTWLSETPPGPTDTVGKWLEENAPETAPLSVQEENSTVIKADEESSSEAELLLPDFSFLDEVDEGPAFIAPEELPDWLKDIPSKPAIDETEPISPPEDVEVEPISKPLTAQPEEKPETTPNLPTWLINLAAKKGSKPKEEEILSADDFCIENSPRNKPRRPSTMQTPKTPSKELPAWLSEIETLPPTEIESSPVRKEKEELPAWLRELEGTPDIPAAVFPEFQQEEISPWQSVIEEPSAPANPEMETSNKKEELPSWLRDLEELPNVLLEPAPQENELIQTREAEEPEQPSEFPIEDWLLSIEEPTAPSMETSQNSSRREELPAWLRDLENINDQTFEKSSATAHQADEEKELGKIKEEISEELAQSASEPQDSTEKLPDWLKDLEAIETGVSEPPVEDFPEGSSFQIPDLESSSTGYAEESSLTGKEKLEISLADETKEGSFVIESAASWTVDDSENRTETSEITPDWLLSNTESPSTSTDESVIEEISLSGDVSDQPEFGNIGAAIDWLENITSLNGSEGTETSPGTPEAEILPFMSQDMNEMEDMDISPPIQPKSAKWVLEAAPLDLGVTVKQPGKLSRQTTEEQTQIYAKQVQSKGPLNINKATLGQLEKLPGMGFRQAQNIINFRQVKGDIHSLEDLRHVPKIDAKLLLDLENRVVFSDPEPKMDSSRFEMSKIEILALAQAHMNQGNIASALEQYSLLIAKNCLLDEVIANLIIVIKKSPRQIEILETLGEAYLAAERYEEALETYRMAEEILQ